MTEGLRAVQIGIEMVWHCNEWKGLPHSDIQWLWSKVIKRLGRESTARECIEKIIAVRDIRVKGRLMTVDEFMGGTNRARYYFPLYYRPIKVLAHLKYIDMPSGSKSFKRLQTRERVDVEVVDKFEGQVALDTFG